MYYEILRDTTRSTSGTTRHYEVLRVELRVTMNHYEVLKDTTTGSQDNKSHATRYYDISWHYKSDEVIQDAKIG